MKHVSLEMTERCNLRCKYCIYHEDQGGFRTFGEKDTTFEVIKTTIDLLSKSTEEEVYVSFYGGEPLLKFDLIKQAIEYSKEKLVGKSVHFNMTTNATLITEDVATYLASVDNYFTTISLDGPEQIHNKNRVFPNGTGSFNATMEGIKRLVKAEGENASKRVNFNIVLEERSPEIFNMIQEFYSNSEILPKGSLITASYVSTKNVESEYWGVGTEREKERISLLREDVDPLSAWGIDTLDLSKTSAEGVATISKDVIHKGLSFIHNRMLIDKPAQTHYMNGCCVPSSRRLYVTVNGDLAVCERVGEAPFIGNIYDGVDFDKVKRLYIDEFSKEAMKYCNDCWAVHMCHLCYINCYDKEGLNLAYRHIHCLANRKTTEKNLVRYHEILENNPESLSFLDDFVVG